MSSASRRQIPGTPRVISPSPAPLEDGYIGPTTRSAARRSARPNNKFSAHDGIEPLDTGLRARSRRRKMSDHAPVTSTRAEVQDGITSKGPRRKRLAGSESKDAASGHLSPASAAKGYWHEVSRSPSPLGLIPIHRQWRSFVHRHEIPRKALHLSIGFLTFGLYARGVQTSSIHPVLLSLLVPIALTDLLRHNWPPFNRFYIRCLGAFMRESEAHERYNGVIWYLLGAWTVLRFFPKDIGVMGVVLLSWCDTAASTFGRLYGRYTLSVRKGKSLAGSLAACAVGVSSALLWWGWLAPRYESLGVANNTGLHAFAFQGALTLPAQVRALLGWTAAQSTVKGGVALGIMSAWAGFTASASEAVDIFGWDDNVTIPVLCGVGLLGFLKVFGAA